MVKEILSVRNLVLFPPFIFLPRVCSDCSGGRAPASQPHLYKWRPPWRPGVWGRSVWQAVSLFSLNSVQCSLASEICSWFCQKTVSPRILKKVILNAKAYVHTHAFLTLVKNPPGNVADTGDSVSIPGSGQSPREGNGNPLQYSCLENSEELGGL